VVDLSIALPSISFVMVALQTNAAPRAAPGVDFLAQKRVAVRTSPIEQRKHNCAQEKEEQNDRKHGIVDKAQILNLRKKHI